MGLGSMAIDTTVGPAVTVNGTTDGGRLSAVQLMFPVPMATPVTVRPLIVAADVFVEVHAGEKQLRVELSLIVVVHTPTTFAPAATLSGFGVYAIETGVGAPTGSYAPIVVGSVRLAHVFMAESTALKRGGYRLIGHTSGVAAPMSGLPV
jgi:hypothetical protein